MEDSGVAAYPLVVFRIEDVHFAVRVSVVERVVRMVAVAPLPSAPDPVLGAINVRGVVVPVFDLRRRVGLGAGEFGPDAHLLVARARERLVALPVDEVIGFRRVPATSVAAPSRLLPRLSLGTGVAALENGILLVQDLDGFLSPEEETELDGALASAGA